MTKIAIIGIIAILLAIPLKQIKPEYSTIISLIACIFIITLGIGKLENILEVIYKLQSFIGLKQGYISILLKMIGITYITELSSSLCTDAGYSAIAKQIELVGKLAILAISMPVLMALLETIERFFN